jgi:hypothetical protein
MHVPYAPLVVVLAVPRSSDVVVMTMNFPSIQKETVHYDGRTVASATVKGPPTPSGASGPRVRIRNGRGLDQTSNPSLMCSGSTRYSAS